MIKKNKKKGFSLIELVIAVAIMGVLTLLLAPSLFHFNGESRIKKDNAKFESICIAFKAALVEPEVRKEVESMGNGNLVVTCYIDANGLITFGDGKLKNQATNNEKTLSGSKLWLNSYQSVGTKYTVSSKEFKGKYLVFYLTPKTLTTTARCTYDVVANRP